MKQILLISASIFICIYCSAQEISTEIKSEHKLNYDQYIDQYGVDDTSRAIIDIFFDKRANNASGKMSFLPLSGAVTVVFPPIGLGLMAISSPLFVSGLITKSNYSRKKLMNILVTYQNNSFLPNKYRERVVELMYAEQEMHIEELLEARYNILK